MLNKRVYLVYLWLMPLLLISSCTDSSDLYEKTATNIENTYTPASTKVEKSATEAVISTPVFQEEMTITPKFTLTKTQILQEAPAITPTFPAYPLGWSSDGWHMWFLSQENPLDELNLRIQDGYTEILNISYGDNVWMATLFRHDNYTDSILFYENLDKEQIEELIVGGNKVKIICPGEGGWLVVTTKDNHYLNQKVIFLSEFNLDEIYKFISEGYWVTELRYWEKQWVVILTETTDILDQKIEMVSDIGPNRSYIDLIDSFLYTSMVYDGQQWIIVRSVLEVYHEQSLAIFDVFYKDIVQQYGWFGEYLNTKIYYGNDQWIYVFTK